MTTASVAFTSQLSKYTSPEDTLGVRATRFSAGLTHAQIRSKLRLAADISGSVSRAKARSAQLSFGDETDSRLVATGSATVRTKETVASMSAGIEAREEGVLLIASGALRLRRTTLRSF